VSVALAKPDPQWKTRIVWTREPKPHAPSAWRHDPERANHTGIYVDPFESSGQYSELDRAIGGFVQVLQSTTATDCEMGAWRRVSTGPRNQSLDDTTFAASAAALTEPGQDAVARNGKGQENRLPLIEGDTVPSRADPLDRELDEILAPGSWCISRHCRRVLLDEYQSHPAFEESLMPERSLRLSNLPFRGAE
jgi:hypothetical protein